MYTDSNCTFFFFFLMHSLFFLIVGSSNLVLPWRNLKHKPFFSSTHVDLPNHQCACIVCAISLSLISHSLPCSVFTLALSCMLCLPLALGSLSWVLSVFCAFSFFRLSCVCALSLDLLYSLVFVFNKT